jgi:hypothetical protein
MEKEFNPYELALALKELGFDEHCLFYYTKDFKISHSMMTDTIVICNFNKNGKLSAPLYQQAFRWFREKYNIVHTVYSNASGYMWELHYNTERGGTHICDSAESGDCEMSGMFTTYEKAEIKCLKKLIEIVKNK